MLLYVSLAQVLAYGESGEKKTSGHTRKKGCRSLLMAMEPNYSNKSTSYFGSYDSDWNLDFERQISPEKDLI